MSTTTTNFRCLHCNVNLPERDIAEGWCDACGKRVAHSIRAEAKRRNAPVPAPVVDDLPDPAPSKRGLMWGAAIITAVGAIALVLILN